MKDNITKAHYLWTELAQTALLDQNISEPLLHAPAPKIPEHGWIRSSREALQISQEDLATQLGISQQALAKLERNESSGAISLERLINVAAAMDCEVVYYVRHKKKKTFAAILWEKLLGRSLKEYHLRMHSHEIKKPMVLAKIAEDFFRHPAFRQEMNWCRNSKI